MKRFHGVPLAESNGFCEGKLVEGMYYIILVSPERGSDQYELWTDPGRKHTDGAICTDGWLGSTNNVSSYAEGAVRIKDGKIRRIKIEEILAFEECSA